MPDREQSYLLNSFIFLLGILLGTFVTLGFLVRAMFAEAGTHLAIDDEEVQHAVAERIEPIGEVLLLGSAELTAAAVAPVVQPNPVSAPLTGPQVYNQACFACHMPPGIAGAPALGDAAAWSARVAQGLDMLVEHALVGFTGEAGVMPAKGGQMQLSDDEVRAAVEFMLEQLNQ